MMITSKLEQDDQRYYRVKFANVPHEVYEWAPNATVAILDALDNLLDDGHPEPLGNAAVRPAAYKEWNHGTEHYTNGGDFIQDTSKPCRECAAPVPFHTHREELGLCLECSNKYWSHED